MKNRAIFLDIDGVLNNRSTTETDGGIIGIDSNNLQLFSQIVRQTNSLVILSSSWRYGWERTEKSKQNQHGNYLDSKFESVSIQIDDKIDDMCRSRGEGILDYLETHQNITEWVVLDDVRHASFFGNEIQGRFVKIDSETGFSEKDSNTILKLFTKEK